MVATGSAESNNFVSNFTCIKGIIHKPTFKRQVIPPTLHVC